ncbi:MAG: hypothetical protein DLM72_03540 [Candidatus Nitrosopolaris wilkensis]|nr:MAG: hypothetical protein DLM72_03540 [Candidatus Nitrosopolaris wilkensis]
MVLIYLILLASFILAPRGWKITLMYKKIINVAASCRLINKIVMPETYWGAVVGRLLVAQNNTSL